MSTATRPERVQPSEVTQAAVAPAVSLPSAQTVRYLTLFLFYLPLGFSGLMMTLDLPVVNAVLNRFPNPNTSVAALSVAFSLALVYEASHISMIDASTALSTDRAVFHMLRRFYVIMAAVLLVLASLVVFTPLFDMIVSGLMNQAPEVARAAHPAAVVFLLWPIPIGWRRLYQGALIKHGHPKPVGAGGIVRLSSLAVALIVFGWVGINVFYIEPAAIAVLAMLVSVTAEAVAVHGWTQRVLSTVPETTPGKPAPTYRDLRRFVFPLSGTSIMSTLVQPIMRAGIAAAAIAWASPNGSVVAVASYQIAWTLAFLTFGPTLSMTQASIAWNSSPDPSVRQRGPRLIVSLGVGLACFMVLVSFTPLAHWMFGTLIGAPEQTAQGAASVARWLVPMPLLHSISFMLRGKLIARHDPRAVRLAQFFDLGAVVAIVFLATNPASPLTSWFHGMSAAVLAAIAYDLMLCVDISILLLALRFRRSR